jgi:hypothetical protein
MTFFNRSHKIAVFCGAIPLSLGTGIFLTWIMFRWNWLALAGLFLLYAGLAALVVGVVALAHFWWVARRWAPVLSCAALLFANLVVAAAIVWAAIAIETHYTVSVRNVSQAPLNDVRVFGGGCDLRYGIVAAGTTARRSCWIGGDDATSFRAISGGHALERTIDGYVTVNMGGHLTVTITPDLKIDVTRQTPHQQAFGDRIRDVLFWMD